LDGCIQIQFIRFERPVVVSIATCFIVFPKNVNHDIGALPPDIGEADELDIAGVRQETYQTRISPTSPAFSLSSMPKNKKSFDIALTVM
jgi:hypothetical protein